VRQLVLPLEEDPVSGWKAHPIFQGVTPNLDQVSCHISVLGPGRSPHPPHRHLEEELLIPLDGMAQLVIAREEDDRAFRVEAAMPGVFAYYPAHHPHTIRNDGAAPITYLMFKWRAAPAMVKRPLAAGIFRYDDSPPPAVVRAFEARVLFERPTSFLGKLHAHLTTIQPGAGYAAHRDAHDVAIIVLSGQVETFEQEPEGEPAGSRLLGPHGVAYYGAGQPHGLRNPGSEPARYLVFEFHAPAAGAFLLRR
jgi:mannose-6-phosphate isomerase-like protein (cupin superfamily)